MGHWCMTSRIYWSLFPNLTLLCYCTLNIPLWAWRHFWMAQVYKWARQKRLLEIGFEIHRLESVTKKTYPIKSSSNELEIDFLNKVCYWKHYWRSDKTTWSICGQNLSKLLLAKSLNTATILTKDLFEISTLKRRLLFGAFAAEFNFFQANQKIKCCIFDTYFYLLFT